MMVAFLIGAAIGFLAGFEEAKTERRYEDADEEPEIYREFFDKLSKSIFLEVHQL